MQRALTKLTRFLLIVAALCKTGVVRGEQTPPETSMKQVIGVNFDRLESIQAPFELFGPNVENYVHAEKEGLRFTIPADRPQLDPVGVVLTAPIHGDFEITAGYEILQAPRPETGYGIGFELYVAALNPAEDAIAFCRSNRPVEGENFFCTRMATGAGKRQYYVQSIPTQVRRGWLTLTRRQNEVTFLVSAARGGPFHEVWRSPFVGDDLQMVRLSAYSGFDPAAFEIRLLDLQIAAGDAPPHLGVATIPRLLGAPDRSSTEADGGQSLTGSALFLLQIGLALAGVLAALGALILLAGQLIAARRNLRELDRRLNPANDRHGGSVLAPAISRLLHDWRGHVDRGLHRLRQRIVCRRP
jgi:hypothetical protein